MGIHDRDYNRTGTGIGGPSNRTQQRLFVHSPGWTVTTWIIVINIGIYILGATILRGNEPNPMESFLYAFGRLSVLEAFQELKVWRLITFQFLHSPFTIWHVVMNMFGMWIFGPIVEGRLGGKKFLAFYLCCGLCGGLLFSILTVLGNVIDTSIPGLLSNDYAMPLIGASAGVFAVIVASAFISPDSEVNLMFILPMKLKWFAYGYVGLALFQLLSGSNNAGGEAAHIGGAIAGFYFIRNPHLLTDFFDVFNDSRQANSRLPKTKKPKRKQSGQPSTDEIDRILAKVSTSGIHSLTDREKKTLSKASSEQQNPR